MRLSAAAFFMILTTIFLSGCGKNEMATVDEHGGSFYGRNGVMSLIASAPAQQAAPTMGVTSNALSPAAPNQTPFATANHWQWPVKGNVTETFGQKTEGVSSEGIVIAAVEGSPIHAAQAGEVAYVGNDAKTYGNIAIIRHSNGDMTSYSHARNVVVVKGARVNTGSLIGYVGQTGNAKQPQLHFAVRQGRVAVDPMSKLPSQLASS
jgi:lipoprotein NlpD